jgi:electron transport complex protein RnfG
MSTQPKKGGYITSAWLVILLALLYGAALAGVEITLKDRIAQNKIDKIFNQLPTLVPGTVAEKTERYLLTETNGGMTKETTFYKLFDADGNHLGWAAQGAGIGFADKIELLVGFNADQSEITGMFVLSQKETPGLGDYITGEEFRSEFIGVPADGSLVVVKPEPTQPQEIHAITGATISSVAVTDIVNGVATKSGEKTKIDDKPAEQEETP